MSFVANWHGLSVSLVAMLNTSQILVFVVLLSLGKNRVTRNTFPLYSRCYFSLLFMAKRFRITWVQVMAILALFGILLGVIGTSLLDRLPIAPTPTISGEVTR